MQPLHSTGFQISKRQFQISRGICHMQSKLCGNHRQFVEAPIPTSARDKEKESKRWALGKIEERNKPTPLPRACPPCRRNKQRRMQTAQSNHPSRRSLI
ncbi:hypothetical protein ACFX14_000059 [Malus domestica]